jgi:hypothetical protein
VAWCRDPGRRVRILLPRRSSAGRGSSNDETRSNARWHRQGCRPHPKLPAVDLADRSPARDRPVAFQSPISLPRGGDPLSAALTVNVAVPPLVLQGT